MQDEKSEQESDQKLLEELRNRSPRLRKKQEKISKLNNWIARIKNCRTEVDKKRVLH